jgi:hypothetical protein
VHVAPSVSAVRALWDRSGGLAGPVIRNYLSSFAAAHSDLALCRSGYGHRATLLHYTAANGIEIRRQLVPVNAAEVVATLLGAGAERSATVRAYGGEFDVVHMLRTGAHPPRDAGVAAALESALGPG